ncbi:MAG: 3-deoxy-8-phosphooctulonate synthase [Proteobacteria bacterium]|nr:3-deoxy-8-phosphooctulonate synthase [Pseudomonadota bacterium]
MSILPLFSPQAPLFLMAGPCALESRQMAMDVAGSLQETCKQLKLPFIFKSSYDKANRTSVHSKRGIGIDEGLDILADVKKTLNVPIITDVHLPSEVATVAAVADVLQIPAFLCRQTDLIAAAAESGRAMNIKKGQFLAPDDMLQVVEKARASGCRHVLVCERGSSFGYHNLIVDMRALVWMRQSGCPVVFDATHSTQLPGGGGGTTTGVREMAAPLARAAVAVGVNGLFIETHPDPQRAISDAATQIPLAEMPALLTSLLAIHRTVTAEPL